MGEGGETQRASPGRNDTAIKIACEGKEPSYRAIGKAVGVNATTVMRWFPDGTFIEEAKKIYRLVKEHKSG